MSEFPFSNGANGRGLSEACLAVVRRIKASDEPQRFQAELSDLIARMEQAGVTVPREARALDADLAADVIDGPFDNLPL